MSVQVIFTHDDEDKSWEVKVTGVNDVIEARQAFSAVIFSCQEIKTYLLDQTKVIPTVDGDFEIHPAV